MILLKVISRILNHPLNKKNKVAAIFRFIKWQINVRINPYPIIYNYTENSKLIIGKSMTGATGDYYCGLLEFPDMSFLLHFLREGDLFIDIGANIGSYTILASGEVKATTISIEPIPSTFQLLENNISINRMSQRVIALNVGVGRQAGTLRFTANKDTVNSVAVESDKDTLEVPVRTLDSIAKDHAPVLLKIDVEGFETEVCNGGISVLEKTSLKAIIIELNRAGERYGFSDEEVHKLLVSKGFQPYAYSPFTRELRRLDTFGSKQNTLYLRDLPFVSERISSARKFKINRSVI